MNSPLKIGITTGDPNGIGPELIIRTLFCADATLDFTPIVYAHSQLLKDSAHQLGYSGNLSHNKIKNPQEAVPNTINLLEAPNFNYNIHPGTSSNESGEYAFQSFTTATNHLINKEINVLVTNPVDKSVIAQTQPGFSGHTSYLTQKSGTKGSLMLMVSPQLTVGTVTEHIPVRKITSSLNPDLLTQKLTLFHHSLSHDFNIHEPHIAVLGLNPHAGDSGLVGKEEETIIEPVLKRMSSEDEGVFDGPFGADGFFGSQRYKQYDGVLGLYHDQILTPFKTISLMDGVNYTAGLPVIRTSPDHGPAFELSGKGIAQTTSFNNAISVAREIYNHRHHRQPTT